MALFLTDDLLKSDKKRKKAPEETTSALTSISERDEPTISLEQRLKDLEIVTNYHDLALRSLEAWSTTAFLMDPDTEPAPTLIKALSTYNETRIESGPHPMGPPRRILAKALGQWLHSQLPSDGPFAKYHAALTNAEDLEHRSVNLLVARKTKKGDKFLLRIRPHNSAVPAWNEAFQMLTHWVRQQPNGEVLYDATPPGTEARHIASRARGHTNVKGRVADRETPRNSESPTFSQVLFFPPLRDSGSTETAVRMSLRCPQVCATGRLERPLQCVVVMILRLPARRIMLVPHEWTLCYSRGIIVVVHVHIHVGSIEPCSRENSTFLGHAH